MNSNYVGIDHIIEEVNRISIPNSYWNIDEIKEWTYKALSFIDTKQAQIQSSTIVEIIDNKGLIPADVTKIDKVILEGNIEKELHYILPIEKINANNYEINAGYIYIYPEKAKLTIQYYTIPIDSEGAPLIPDDKYYIQAIIAYIRFNLGTRAYWQNKILERQLTMLEQEWLFYLPAAQNSTKLNTLRDSKRFRRISNRHFM